MTAGEILERLAVLRIKPANGLCYVCPDPTNGIYIFAWNKTQAKNWQTKLEAKGCKVIYCHDNNATYLHVKNIEKL